MPPSTQTVTLPAATVYLNSTSQPTSRSARIFRMKLIIPRDCGGKQLNLLHIGLGIRQDYYLNEHQQCLHDYLPDEYRQVQARQ